MLELPEPLSTRRRRTLVAVPLGEDLVNPEVGAGHQLSDPGRAVAGDLADLPVPQPEGAEHRDPLKACRQLADDRQRLVDAESDRVVVARIDRFPELGL